MARITGTPFDDILTGTPKRDRILGSEGNDELRGLDGNDSLDGGLGLDVMIGGEGDDWFLGGPHVDVPGEDDDTIDGGDGQDWVTYASLKQPNHGVQIFLGDDGGFAEVLDPNGDFQLQVDLLYNIENAIGSPVGYSVLSGNSSDNTLIGIGPRTNFLSSAGSDTYQIKGGGHASFFFLDASEGIIFDLPHKQS